MTQLALSKSLKTILVGVWLCGLALYFLIIPDLGSSIAAVDPEYAYCYWPWLIFIWCTGIPVAAAMLMAWRISTNIGADRSFSMQNAKLLKWIEYLAAGDAAFFFVGNIVLYIALGVTHPGIMIGALVVIFACLAVAVAAAVLSHLVMKAALMQEENDLTI